MKWMKIIPVLTLAFTLAFPAGAQEKDDYSVIAIKKKYFLKAKRYEFGINAGIVPNDSFVTGFTIGGNLGYHFSETFFAEIVGGLVTNRDTASTKFLRDDVGIQVDTDDIDYYGEVHLGWTPIYGKLSFLTKKIIYFDFSIYGGGGFTSSVNNEFSPHAVIGVAQRFVLNKWMALRFDLKDAIIFRDNAGVRDEIRDAVYFLVSLNFFLPLR